MTQDLRKYQSILGAPPDYVDGLTFHLPLFLQAAREFLESPDDLEKLATEQLREADLSDLVSPPFFDDLAMAYAPSAVGLLDADESRRYEALASLNSLAPGLSGAAFHGLIRLGYGLRWHDPIEVGRGLAYLGSRRQILIGPRERSTQDRARLPPGLRLDGTSIYDQLALLDIIDGGEVQDVDTSGGPLEAVRSARAMLRANPRSFAAIHCFTGLHGVLELHAAVTGTIDLDPIPEMEVWYRHYLIARNYAYRIVLAYQGGTTTTKAMTPGGLTWDDIQNRLLHSPEPHDLKVAVAAKRMVAMGLMETESAIELALLMLQCSGPVSTPDDETN